MRCSQARGPIKFRNKLSGVTEINFSKQVNMIDRNYELFGMFGVTSAALLIPICQTIEFILQHVF